MPTPLYQATVTSTYTPLMKFPELADAARKIETMMLDPKEFSYGCFGPFPPEHEPSRRDEKATNTPTKNP